jgi:hypothetical protein
MSKLTEFYDESGVDCDGRKIADIWKEDDEYFEYCHNYVQWLFPIPEPSNFNPDAPLLTEDDIKIFKANPTIQLNLRASFHRYLAFFGLVAMNGEVIATEAFEPILFKFANHNWFRITRVLKSLRLLGCEKEATAFYSYLKKIHEEKGWVSDNSFSYWKEAME